VSLEDLVRERARRERPAGPPPAAGPRIRGPNPIGCLLRLVMIVLFVFVLGYMGLLMLAGSIFRAF
jgi:hypothetical protein